MTTWDTTVDFVIAGSGGGGMVAALAAADAGAEALVLEKQALVGGSTCMSGGIFWIPNNPLMRAEGVPDSYEDAMAHFETVVGDVGPCSSLRAAPCLPHRRPGDDHVPAAPRRAPRHLPRLQRLLLQPEGRPRRRPRHRAGAVGRAGARAVAAEAAAGAGPDPRAGGDDQRGPVAVELQPERPQLRHLGPGGAPHRGGQGAAAGAAHERRVAHRSAARRRRRQRRSRCGPRPRWTT